MQYLLTIYASESAVQRLSDDAAGELIAAYGRYTEDLKKAGAYVGSNRLQAVSTATTVRARNGKQSAVDGPYAETKEQLGGYYLIDAADREAALQWAARCPGASYGAIEVRPIWVG